MYVHAATDGLMCLVLTLFGLRVAVFETSIFIGRFSTRQLLPAYVVLIINAPTASCVIYY